MTENKRHKCYYNLEGKFHSCTAMTILLDNSKEIEVPTIINFNTMKESNRFVAWKGTKRIKGISFNVCPFCGENIMNIKQQLNTNKIPLYKAEKVKTQ